MDGIRSLAIIAAFAAAAPLPVAPAHADAGSFLRSIEGAYRGRGTAMLPGRETEERINCKVSNRYDAEAKALEIKGDCATTQAKSSVNGRINHSGDKVSGALMGSFEGATITKSDGGVTGNRLVVSTNFVDNATGTLTRSRQVIRKTGQGFEAEFFTYDNKQGKFLKAGAISFSQN